MSFSETENKILTNKKTSVGHVFFSFQTSGLVLEWNVLARLVSCRFDCGGAGVRFQSVFTSVSVGLPSRASAGDSSSV